MRAAALALGLVLIGPAQASANRAARGHGANTFSGSCKLSGTSAFDPPLTNTQQPGTQQVQAKGTCSGTFNGRHGRAHHLNNAPVGWQTTEYTSGASCGAGTLSGIGQITFQYGTIRFTISENTVGPVAAFTLKGAQRGSAVGQANISPSADPVALTEACAGAGITEAPVQIQVTTTPSISG
jgi:hypothetical protein